MIRGSKERMISCVIAKSLVVSALVLPASTAFAVNEKKMILRPLKESSRLLKQTEKNMETEGMVDAETAFEAIVGGKTLLYLVPVIDGGSVRGCYLYTYGNDERLKQEILLSASLELESCQATKAVFACNQKDSGIGVLYVKRLGSDHYSFEGAYLAMEPTGLLKVDEKRSKLLNDVESVTKAKKRLKCL